MGLGSLITSVFLMMGAVPRGIDPALLPDSHSEGARLLVEFCTQCHALPGPGLHTAKEWPAVVGRMDVGMHVMGCVGMVLSGTGIMGRIDAPSGRELDAILAYLQRHAEKPVGPELRNILETKAGRALQPNCSQCHALPEPSTPQGNARPRWGG